MSIAVSTIARASDLTTVERVRASGLAFPTSDEADVNRIIAGASAAIVNYCERPFAREAITEATAGYGGILLQLERTPIVSVVTVFYQYQLITDFTIDNADQGTLYRAANWPWTVQQFGGLAGGSSDPYIMAYGTPVPNTELRAFIIDYVAGYILPPLWLTDATVSVDSADNSFNVPAGTIPTLLRTGDVIKTAGFTDPLNNGRFLVGGIPTAEKVRVSGSLVTEAEAAGRSIEFHPPAQCRPFDDLERACFEAVKSWYAGRGRESGIVERQISSTRVRWSEADMARALGLPPTCVGLLRPWKR